MIKTKFNIIFSVIMALMVLLSTLSFTIEKHFCGDTLIDVALFSELENCGMAMETISVDSMKKKQCCHDILEVVQGQDKLKKSSIEEFQLSQQPFISPLIFSYIDLFEGLPEQIIPHIDYSPPHLVADIQVWQQVFII